MTQGGLQVHDLNDRTGGRGLRRAPPPTRYGRGAASALMAFTALLAAAIPGGDRLPHVVIAAVLGVPAALIAIGVLRRARRVGALVLPAVALLLLAGAAMAVATRPADSDNPDVVIVQLPIDAEAAATGALVESGPGDHRALTAVLDGMLLRLQSVHRTEFVYPTKLTSRGPWVVVPDGPGAGTYIGRLPPATRLTYAVASDHGYVQLTLTTQGAVPLGVMGDSLVQVTAP